MQNPISGKENELQNICRICLLRNGLINVNDIVNNEEISLKEMLQLCTNVEEDNNFPKNICLICLNDLIKVYKFIIKCRNSTTTIEIIRQGLKRENSYEIDIEDAKPDAATTSNEIFNGICNFCSEELATPYLLEYHIWLHTQNIYEHNKAIDENILFMCEVCGAVFNDNSVLKQHVLNHSENEAHNCCYCGKDFQNAAYLKDHIYKRHFEKINENYVKKLREPLHTDNVTKQCDENLTNYDEIIIKTEESESLKDENDNESIVEENLSQLGTTCNICSKEFSCTYFLNRHMHSHTNRKSYECDICLAMFTNCSNLIRHKRIHTGEKPYVCQKCDKAYTQSSTLYQHNLIHHEEKLQECPCGESFKNLKPFKTHIITHLNQSDPMSETDKELLRSIIHTVKCKICGRMLSSKVTLRAHMLIHSDKKFLCCYCGKKFISKPCLLIHYRTHTGEKPYKCGKCEKVFTSQSSLKQHTSIHTGEKRYVCKICSRKFIQQQQLTSHLRIHSGEKPYECNFCKRSFRQKGNLIVHQRTHTGQRPYICSVCNQDFSDSSSFRKHLNKHQTDNK